ncbi:hypothetical protein BT63DRAFT_457706 [Microthyrium microscopicum]|uniref:NAD(P)-binding protein n=1 Tax=Microthyrium microscopicum TaxID=703497 RepID=A0A6A6U3N8_9PEZI|nr:hypothetical protein BT63DRAFT_457706 [Microthyrium microscopicum]
MFATPLAEKSRSQQSPASISTPSSSTPGKLPEAYNSSPPVAVDSVGSGSVSQTNHRNGSAIQESSPSVRKKNSRRIGGFLLGSTFQKGSRKRHKSPEAKDTGSNGNGKHVMQSRGSHDVARISNDAQPSNELRNFHESPGLHSSNAGTRLSYDYTPTTLTRSFDSPRQGTEDSPRTSYDPSIGPDSSDMPTKASIDASQIVSMALNLSEGRRRNFSGHNMQISRSGNAQRVVSSSGAPILQPPYGHGGTLRKHLQDQRRISRNPPDEFGRKSPGPRIPSSSFRSADANTSLPLRVSSATEARVAKARQHIELAVEYHRLLEHLPPLQPQQDIIDHVPVSDGRLPKSGATRNHHGVSLGRQYNPLQLIRNRKARARARNPLQPGAESWENPEAVDDWINIVENVATRPNYMRGDEVALPRYPPRQYDALDIAGVPADPSASTSGTTNRPTRPRLDWFTSPGEFLADAYWLEQGYHKTIIEGPMGHKLFPYMAPLQEPRASVESRHSRHGSLQLSAGSEKGVESEPESHVERRGRQRQADEQGGQEESKRFRVWQRGQRRSRSSSSRLSHSDDEEGKLARPLNKRHTSDFLDTAPLAKHLSSIMDQQQSLAPLDQSPQLVSPGTPNKWGLDQNGPRESNGAPDRNGVRENQPPPSLRLQAPFDSSSPAEIVSTRPAEELGSVDGSVPSSPILGGFMRRAGTEPFGQRERNGSPSRKPTRHLLPFVRSEHKDSKRVESGSTVEDSDRSFRKVSEEPKPTRHSLDVPSQAHHHSHLHHHHGKHLFSTKTHDSLNSETTQPSIKAKDVKEREADSAVRRFFKGGRIGDVLRGENSRSGSMRRKREPTSDPHANMDADTESMDESDTDDISGSEQASQNKRDPKLHKIVTSGMDSTDSSHSPRKLKLKYNFELPAFRPANPSLLSSRPSTPEQEKRNKFFQAQSPLREDKLLHKQKRSPDTPGDSTTSLSLIPTGSTFNSPEQNVQHAHHHRSPRQVLSDFHSKSHNSTSARLNTALEQRGAPSLRGSDSLPPTALTTLRKEHSPARLPFNQQRLHVHDRGRHWSISDPPSAGLASASTIKPQPTRTNSSTTLADLARIRTILMCTGIKAATLNQRTTTMPPVPPEQLMAIANSLHKETPKVSRGETHLTAARLLTDSMETDTAALHASATAFRAQTIGPLNSALAQLRTQLIEAAELARTAGDEAVGFGAVVTGAKTIEVRSIVEGMEKFRRKRRRRLRWIRRVGFGLLEWGVLLFMWWVCTVGTVAIESLKVPPCFPMYHIVCSVRRFALHGDERASGYEVEKLASDVKATFGRVDIVVANAGVLSDHLYDDNGKITGFPVGTLEEPDFERTMTNNIFGTRNTAKYFLPLLSQSKDGAKMFVATSSSCAWLEHTQISPLGYNLSKLVINRMVESIHNYYHEKDGIVAYSIHPGQIKTDLTKRTQELPNAAMWEAVLVDDVSLPGGFVTSLAKEKPQWLSGRYLTANWDVDELLAMKDDIVPQDKLKARMII